MTWEPTVTYGTWGQIRVVIDGLDVTTFRDTPAYVQGWDHTDPYGPNSATINFPQVTLYDDRDTDPDLAWLREGAIVLIEQVLDGEVVSTVDPPFYGWIDAVDETDAGISVSCSGNFNGRLSTRMHQPKQGRRYGVDIGRTIWREIGYGTPHISLYPHEGLDTGIVAEMLGSRDMTRLGRLDELLALAVTESGNSLTILPDPDHGRNGYRVQWRTLKDDPDATVYAGAHGVKVSLRRDLLDMTSAVYGEGVAPSGERWRNRVFPNLDHSTPVPPYPFNDNRSFGLGATDDDTDTGDGVFIMNRELWSDGLLNGQTGRLHEFTDDVEDAVQEMQRNLHLSRTGVMTPSLWTKLYTKTGDKNSQRSAYFAPLAIDPRTEYLDRASDGTPVGLNPEFDIRVPVVEEFQNYGEGVRKRAARRNARSVIARAAARNGTVTLTSDPAEMSRFDIRAGMTLQLRHVGPEGAIIGHDGRALNLYISQVTVDWATDNKPVTLAVSTTPKHYIDLATIRERNREARRNPAKKAAHQHRRSSHVADATQGWEGESGAGVMTHRNLQGGKWNVFSFPACERGVMRDLRYDVSPNVEFYFAVFADHVYASTLQKRLGDPSQWIGSGADQVSAWEANAAWLVEDERRLVEGWGNPDNPCGYQPYKHTKDGQTTTHPLTGRLRDAASWGFESDTGDLWVAIWPVSDCTGYGQAKIQVNETS